MLPAVFGILVWWWPEIFNRNKSCNIEDQNVSNDIITKKDIEYFITNLIVLGVQHFLKKHNKTKSILIDILETINTPNKRKK